jgi:hypothetical protein
MRYLPGIIAAAVLIAGAAQASELSVLKDTTSAVRADPDRLSGKEERARTASVWGLDWSAVNLMEKAVAKRASPLSRFNLAATYARVGRNQAAIALYRQLLVDGQYTQARLDRSELVNRREVLRNVNLADESARRLAVLERPARRSAATPFTATEAGVNAAAIEGVARVSDEQAIALDAQAFAARHR